MLYVIEHIHWPLACVCSCSFQLQAETRHFLQAQGLLAFLKKDLCGRLWRAGYYPVVEGLRKSLSQAASSEDREGEQTQSVPAQLQLPVCAVLKSLSVWCLVWLLQAMGVHV